MTIEHIITLDGDAHADGGAYLMLTFAIRNPRWGEPDPSEYQGSWEGSATLAVATVLGQPIPLDVVRKHLGEAWVASLEADAFTEWAENEPSPNEHRAMERADRGDE